MPAKFKSSPTLASRTDPVITKVLRCATGEVDESCGLMSDSEHCRVQCRQICNQTTVEECLQVDDMLCCSFVLDFLVDHLAEIPIANLPRADLLTDSTDHVRSQPPSPQTAALFIRSTDKQGREGMPDGGERRNDNESLRTGTFARIPAITVRANFNVREVYPIGDFLGCQFIAHLSSLPPVFCSDEVVHVRVSTAGGDSGTTSVEFNETYVSDKETLVVELNQAEPSVGILSVEVTGRSECMTPIRNESYLLRFINRQIESYRPDARCRALKMGCQACLDAGCNWCDWKAKPEGELPIWIPEGPTIYAARNEGIGLCGIHRTICAASLGAHNACYETPHTTGIFTLLLCIIIVACGIALPNIFGH